jgi:tetratricopeptide (TPR) repeat protein
VKTIVLWLIACLISGGIFAATTNSSPKKQLAPPSTVSDLVEKEYLKLLAEDDSAQAEVDKWIREANAFEAQGSPLPKSTLDSRIKKRFDAVRKAYEDFLLRNPKHPRALLAYGSFLNDIREEDEAVIQWEKARELDPTNPAAWNNLANHYGHRGPVKKAFEYYGKAIELDPKEAVYLQNLATTTYLFRTDAKEFYNANEQQVFDRALDLYKKALALDPDNFPLATDYAQTYYGIKPLRVDEAIAAWNIALKIANDDFERQGVLIHLARVEINGGRFSEAREQLQKVTDQRYQVLKERLIRNLEAKSKAAANVTNPAAASVASPK